MAAVAEKPGEAEAQAQSANNNNSSTGSNNDNQNLDSKSKPESEFSVQKLVDMFTKLNPLAKEFFPSSYNHKNLNQSNDKLSVNNFPAANKQSGNEILPNNNNRRVLMIVELLLRISLFYG